MKTLQLHRFPGGLELPFGKSLTRDTALGIAPLPGQLVFPLLQHSGENALPRVAVGDRVRKGDILAGGLNRLDPPVLASASGWVRAIEDRPIPHPADLTDLCIIIEPDDGDESAGLEAWPDFRQHSPEDLLGRIHDAGITGLGGAGFPAAAKLAGAASEASTLIINGVECEPYVTCDEALLREFAHEVLEGARILQFILNASQVLLAIENELPAAIVASLGALLDREPGNIRLAKVPARYPAGGERQLIQTLLGREVPSGTPPARIGVVCQNAGTAAAVYRAVVRGEPLCSRIVTVTGPGIRQPHNLEARLGTPLADLVSACGGYTPDAAYLILGGPMMGFAVTSDALPVTRSTSAVLVLDGNMARGRPATLPCIRCGACADACPAGLLPQQLYWHACAGQLDRTLDQHLFDCIECGCCDVVCPSHIPLVDHFRTAKGQAIRRQREREKASQAQERHEARQARLAEEQRQRAEAIQKRKDTLGKVATPQIQQALERARRKRAAATRPDSSDPSA